MFIPVSVGKDVASVVAPDKLFLPDVMGLLLSPVLVQIGKRVEKWPIGRIPY
jgi:hypothetical protein